MRELTKSMMSYSWSMSLFGVQQMMNLLTPTSDGDPCGKTAQAFANVTDATTKALDGSLKEAFKMGDSFQKGMMDFMFGGFMSAGFDPNSWARTGSDTLRRMTDMGRNVAQGVTHNAGFASAGPSSASGTNQPSAGPSTVGPSTASSMGSGWGPPR